MSGIFPKICIGCGKTITPSSIRCHKCANKIVNALPEKREKISKSLMGRPVSEVTRRKISNSLLGHPMDKKSKIAFEERNKSVSDNPKLHWNYKDGRSLVFYSKCVICGKEKAKTINKNCSKCSAKILWKKEEHKKLMRFVNKPVRGKDHWNWQGGISKEEYGPEFDSSLKERVRFRDGYKCQVCGCSQVENGKQLDVHHIDYNKKNNDIKNLISLCVKDHVKTNFNREYWKEYFSNRSLVR